MNLGLILQLAAQAFPERVILVDGDSQLTVERLAALAGNAAAYITASGCQTVIYVSPYRAAYAVALFGAAKARVPLVPLNYRLSKDQLAELIVRYPGSLILLDEQSRARLAGDIYTAWESLDTAAWLRDLESVPGEGVARGKREGAQHREGGKHGDEMRALDGVAVVLHTSGTTSAPKGVPLRHDQLAHYVLSTVELGSADANEAACLSVPPYHVAGLANLLTNLYAGRRCVLLPAFSPEGWLEMLAREKVTHVMVVPTMLARVVEWLGEGVADLPSLVTLSYGGSRCAPKLVERAIRAFPNAGFVQAYGLTETASTITVLGPEEHRKALGGDPAWRARLASVGRPIPGVEIEIRGPDGTKLPPGEEGRIWVRGRQVSGEYLGQGSALDEAGWFDTRDRGYVDPEGYLFVSGRDDDTIIRGGENIAPAEVEDVLASHEAVAEAAVIGVPDEEWGNRIIAAVVLRPGAKVMEEELLAWSRDHLRSSRSPEEVRFWDALPRTDTGKLLRRTVKERLLADESDARPGADGR